MLTHKVGLQTCPR